MLGLVQEQVFRAARLRLHGLGNQEPMVPQDLQVMPAQAQPMVMQAAQVAQVAQAMQVAQVAQAMQVAQAHRVIPARQVTQVMLVVVVALEIPAQQADFQQEQHTMQPGPGQEMFDIV
jgi:hypothetical protein